MSSAAVLVLALSSPGLWDDRFDRFGVGNGIVTGGALLGSLTLVLVQPEPRPGIRGGVAFDAFMSEHTRSSTTEGRRRAALVSDFLLTSAIAHPFVDAAIASGSDRTAGTQIALISVQSYAITSFIKLATERVVQRERPFVNGCTTGDTPGFPTCDGSGNNKSFFSGHTAMSFTGAGLVCAHHAAMPIYTRGWDALACAGSVTLATATGLLRMVADEHYATDVFVGAVIGFVSGFVVPTIAHYRRAPEAAAPGAAPSAASSPIVSFAGAF